MHESKLLWIDYSGTHPSPCIDSGWGAQDRGREQEQKEKCGPAASVGTSGATCGLVMVVMMLLTGAAHSLERSRLGSRGGRAVAQGPLEPGPDSTSWLDSDLLTLPLGPSLSGGSGQGVAGKAA